MPYLYCAICRERFEPDDTHGRVKIERRTTDGMNGVEEYVLCEDHRIEIANKWDEPV